MVEKLHTKQLEGGAELVSLDSGIGGMPFGKEERLTEEQAARKRDALRLFKQGYESQMRRELDEAVELYKECIEAYPTAEAHTFLGWTYSFMGMTDEAIAECHKAIEVDPDFGNPYNDIGAYLIEKGDLNGAIEWLKLAAGAKRYECYFYPHFNLGRVYEGQGEVFAALREYKEAALMNPGYKAAVRAFRKLQSKLN